MSIPTNPERAAIADAVSAVINAAASAQVFGSVTPVVQRCYVALEDLPNVPYSGPLVTIVPLGPETRELISRQKVEKDLEVLVGIEQRLPQACQETHPSGNQAIDAMDMFAEQVAAILEPDEDASPPRTGVLVDRAGNEIAAWVGAKIVVYNYNRLREHRIYTSSIIVKYRRY